MSDKKYTMQISLNVLNHLGINLYSNIPSVLAEVVANSWDADASRVDIQYDKENNTLTIVDDGCGMTEKGLNDRYLYVGYQRREKENCELTQKNRKPMGRKGIGKLSLFSIADKIHVQSKRDEQENAFLMDADAIRDKMKDDSPENLEVYNPKQMQFDGNLLQHNSGTAIKITDLKKRFTKLSVEGLRKRLARRFSVIGKDGFAMFINGKEVKYSDRDYFHKARFLFQYGKDKFSVYCTKLDTDDSGKPMVYQRCYQFDGNGQAVDNSKYEIKGWIAYAHRSHDLDGNAGEDNLNNIAITVRGKVAQEDILHQFRMGSHASKFIYGEIQADFLDEDSEDDIATSSRQGIVEDEPRYQALKKFIDHELHQIRTITDKSKAKKGVEKALKFHPKIKEWYDKLGPDSQSGANKIFASIEQHFADNDRRKADLYVNAILAFEKIQLEDSMSKLDKIGPENVEVLLDFLGKIDNIEAAHYYEIVHERLGVIEKLDEITTANEKEKVVQKYLFDHLWLLDPAWERATTDEKMEKAIKDMYEKKKQKNLRIDIRYKNISNEHVIIELKRSSVQTDKSSLEGQIKPYMDIVKSKLATTNKVNESVAGICIVGKLPKGWNNITERRKDEQSLQPYKIRVLTYDELISNARSAYSKFIEKQGEVGELRTLIQEIRKIPDSYEQ